MNCKKRKEKEKLMHMNTEIVLKSQDTRTSIDNMTDLAKVVQKPLPLQLSGHYPSNL